MFPFPNAKGSIVNATVMAHRAYAPDRSSIHTPRSTEYEVIARITHRLSKAAGTADTDFSTFAAALHENRKLWTVLAADVADPNNDLPQDLRARIFYLAEFTMAYTSKVLTKGATVDALLDVNTSILRGLKQDGTAT